MKCENKGKNSRVHDFRTFKFSSFSANFPANFETKVNESHNFSIGITSSNFLADIGSIG